jgi:hypothetical protein
MASHLGLFPGFTSSNSWIPSQRIGIFVLCNSSEMPIQSITDTVLGETLR